MSDFDFEGPSDKRGRGRPATHTVKLAARVPAEVDAAVKAYAAEHFITVSDAVRILLERGLNGPNK